MAQNNNQERHSSVYILTKKQEPNKSRDKRPLYLFLCTHHCLIDLVKLTAVEIEA